MATQLEELDLHFDPSHVVDWAYKASDGKIMPYGAGISYFTRGLSVAGLNEDNTKEARSVKLTDTQFSITANGLYVGVVYWDKGKEKEEPNRLKFEAPVPLDEALSGEQPPITGFYPRVVFPSEGEFKYGIIFGCHPDEKNDIFGTRTEEYVIEVPDGTFPGSVTIPESVKYPKAVIASLAEFLKGFEEKHYTLPEGEYSLTMEVERMPIFTCRFDGYRPMSSRFREDGEFPKELPLADRNPHGLFHSYKFLDRQGGSRSDPLERCLFKDEKYVEKILAGPGEIKGWLLIDGILLEHDGVEDKADLMYVALRRSESIAESKTNPNLGLVELQVSRAIRVKGANVSYTPKKVERPVVPDSMEGFLGFRSCLFDITDDDSRASFGDINLSSRGGHYRSMSQPVNTGKTVFANPRTGPVSPTIEAEWDGHIQNFRFCLTNGL